MAEEDKKKKDEHAGGEEHGHKKKKHKSHHHSGGGHGGGEHEGAPEWLISFADNVTLMMGFFVIMLAMNMNPPATGSAGGEETGGAHGIPHPGFMDAAIAIREAFNNPVDMSSANPADQALIQRLRQRKSERDGLGRVRGLTGDQDDVQAIRPSDYYTDGGVIPFNQSSARLTDGARRALATIADNLRGRRFYIEVRGHVSALEAMAGVDSAMKLSYDRAMAVAQGLVANDIPWERLRVVGAGDFDRAKQLAYSQAEHISNQRVEILVTREMLPEDPHLEEPSSAGPLPSGSPDAPEGAGADDEPQ